MVSKTYDSGEDPWLEISPIYGLTLFIAGGIYFLFKRYQRIKYRAVPFTVKVPAAASSKWTSVVIENPSLESHLMNSSLMPTARVPLLMQGIHHPGSKKADDDTPLYITCFDPSTGYHLDTISADSEYDIAEKISLARRAWAKSRWGESTFNERKRVMRSLLRWVVKNRETYLVQLICCYPSEADALTMSPHIKHITFIGSETVGRKILQAASIHLTPVTLELGGKDPCVILPETDLPKWIDVWLRGSFQNCGQNCIGIERFIVHSSQHDQLVKLLTEKTKKLRFGPALAEGSNDGGYVAPVDCGSMISRHRFGDLERVIQEAEEEGATVFLGGHPWKHPYVEEGMYFEGTVVANVSPSMEIAQHELFAPVITVMPYNTVEDAIAIANGTRYGLGASVFGPKQHECLNVARALECGMVSINDFGVFYMNQDLGFGGVKASGFGRFAGPEGLRGLTCPKAITVDRWPWLIQTSIPAPLQYPIRSIVKSWDFLSGMIQLFWGESIGERTSGVFQIIKASR
ncbi:Meiotic Sister-Chromatid recombination aldehyde dehydrogenase [Serendipita sp. 407]|nr:Meiotic Sister-Chromatid recombination aldehyde dehydrogenase [Serendipita sp. 407]